MKTSHITLFWCILIFITITFGLVFGEMLCRITGVGKPNLTLTGPKQLFISDPDPQLAFRMRPNYEDFVYGSTVSINEKGLRDHEYVYEKQENIKRILVLGDSVAFGYGVNVEDTFAKQWETFLNQQRPDEYQIINSGVPSYTTAQEVRWLELEGLKYQPDAIVLIYVMNDPEPTHQLDSQGGFVLQDIDQYYAEIAKLFPQPVLPMTQTSQLMNFLNRLLLHTHPNWHEIHSRLKVYFNQTIFAQPGWTECERAAARLQTICEERDIYLLVVIYPLMYRLHDKEEHDFLPHYEQVQTMFSEKEENCILLLDDYIGEHVDTMRAYVDDPHPSRESHLIMAKRLHQTFLGETNRIPGWNKYTIENPWNE